MNATRQAFKEYTESLGKQTNKLKHWIGESGPYKLTCNSLDNFKVTYTYVRANSDYEDYETFTTIPYEYMECGDYVEFLADLRFKEALEAKAKEKKKLEEELRNAEYNLKASKEKVETLKARLLK